MGKLGVRDSIEVELFCELTGLSPCLHRAHKAKNLRRVEKPDTSNDKKFAGLATFICVNCEKRISRALLSRLFTFFLRKFPSLLSNFWARKKEAVGILDFHTSTSQGGQSGELVKVLLAYVFTIQRFGLKRFP